MIPEETAEGASERTPFWKDLPWKHRRSSSVRAPA